MQTYPQDILKRIEKMEERKMEKMIEMMKSADYKERFKGEYLQLKDRCEKLKRFNTKIEAAQATRCYEAPFDPIGAKQTVNKVEMPKHDCPEWLLKEQQDVMERYLHLLEMRALIENIDLEEM